LLLNELNLPVELTFDGHCVEKVMFWSLTLLSRSKTKSILPFNFEELTYVAHVFLPHVIYENVDNHFDWLLL
jgi:hypothetical protein